MPPRDIVFRSYVARYGRAVACLAVRPIKSSICGPADSGLFIGLYHDPQFPRHEFKKMDGIVFLVQDLMSLSYLQASSF